MILTILVVIIIIAILLICAIPIAIAETILWVLFLIILFTLGFIFAGIGDFISYPFRKYFKNKQIKKLSDTNKLQDPYF